MDVQHALGILVTLMNQSHQQFLKMVKVSYQLIKSTLILRFLNDFNLSLEVVCVYFQILLLQQFCLEIGTLRVVCIP